MLTRTMEKIADAPSMYNNIDVDRIKDKIKAMQKNKKLELFTI